MGGGKEKAPHSKSVGGETMLHYLLTLTERNQKMRHRCSIKGEEEGGKERSSSISFPYSKGRKGIRKKIPAYVRGREDKFLREAVSGEKTLG